LLAKSCVKALAADVVIRNRSRRDEDIWKNKGSYIVKTLSLPGYGNASRRLGSVVHVLTRVVVVRKHIEGA
jgi:hypothetical protein